MFSGSGRAVLLLASVVVGGLLAGSLPARATTVLQTDIWTLMARSALVFEGRVLAVEPRASGKLIHTFVTFEPTEILKGSWADVTIELSFVGGSVGARTVTVSGMTIPAVGERGVFFVEDPSRSQLNPFFGWSQGHLRIQDSDDGLPRVTTAAREPIVAIEPSRRARLGVRSRGIAVGVVERPRGDRSLGLTLDDVKRTLRSLAKAQAR